MQAETLKYGASERNRVIAIGNTHFYCEKFLLIVLFI